MNFMEACFTFEKKDDFLSLLMNKNKQSRQIMKNKHIKVNAQNNYRLIKAK